MSGMTLSQLLAGIRQVESGGNYSVVNSIGAVGAYQVMKANIPSWTKRALGYSMTWQQFRDSRAAQDKVAQVILGGYFNKYGAEGAAAMWFSGQPNPNSSASDGGNTVRSYVDKVIAASGGSPGTTASSSTGSGAAVGGSIAPLDLNQLAESYGLTTALINSSSELKKLFKQAAAGNWSADLFTAHLKNTKWWQTQSDTLRQYITLKYTDPATWKQKNAQALSDMNALAVSVGLGDLLHGNANSKSLLNQAAYNSLALGWSNDRIKDWLGGKIGLNAGGEAGDLFDKLHSLAYTNGLKLSDAWYLGQVRAIEGGRSTEQISEASIRKWAAAKYSAFADQIKAGQNVMDLASPYIQSVSKILEIPSTNVDLFNNHVAKAMSSNVSGQAESIWQFENDLRKDPLWKKTQNAQDSAMQVAHQVLQNFGMVF